MSEDENEFDLEFSDMTLIEAKGNYAKVVEIMDDEFTGDVWMLRTDVTIATDAGSTFMVLHFYNDGNVYIFKYMPSSSDIFFNTDIQYLSWWMQDSGWNVPRVHKELIDENIYMWKQYWETMLVDSEYLDGMFGERIADYSDEEDDDSIE